jgi:AcrR family transcriptional regulator
MDGPHNNPEKKTEFQQRESGSDASVSGRGEEARQRLIAAGLEVFGRYGYEAASTRQIAERAGVNLSAITYHYGNKAGLYNAVVATIAERMSRPLVPLLAEVNTALEASSLTPEEAARWLEEVLDALAKRILDISQGEATLIVPIWIREQVDPTPAFDTLYETVMSRMLRPCTALMAHILNRSEVDQECRVRVFALVGQVVVFRLVRVAVLRTTGWTEYDEDNIAYLRGIIRQHVRAILNAAVQTGEERK